MEIKVTLEGLEPNSPQTKSLETFLNQRQIQGVQAIKRQSKQHGPNELGLDWLNELLAMINENPDVLIFLVKAIIDWRNSNPKNKITVIVEDIPGLGSLKIEGSNQKEIERQLEKFKRKV